MGVTRFELVASSVSGKRSPPELNAHMLCRSGNEGKYKASQGLRQQLFPFTFACRQLAWPCVAMRLDGMSTAAGLSCRSGGHPVKSEPHRSQSRQKQPAAVAIPARRTRSGRVPNNAHPQRSQSEPARYRNRYRTVRNPHSSAVDAPNAWNIAGVRSSPRLPPSMSPQSVMVAIIVNPMYSI